MLSRRDLVGKLAAGTAVVWTAGVARAALRPAPPEAKTSTGAERDDQRAAVPNEVQPGLPAPQGAPDPALTRVVDARPPATLEAPVPWDLVRPLAMGSAVAHGWSVAGLTGAVDGSCVLTLQNERGRTHRVHLCRNDGRPQGLVYTREFDLVVMNGGASDLPTEESFAQAVAEVAHVLAANEADRRQAPVVAALLPHAERVERFAGPVNRNLR